MKTKITIILISVLLIGLSSCNPTRNYSSFDAYYGGYKHVSPKCRH